jgi:hypothetical protein
MYVLSSEVSTMSVLEEDVRTLRLAEQGVMRQALETKAARIGELEAEVRYLRRLLNDMLAVPKAQRPAGGQTGRAHGAALGRSAPSLESVTVRDDAHRACGSL